MGAGSVFGPPCLTSSRERPVAARGPSCGGSHPRERPRATCSQRGGHCCGDSHNSLVGIVAATGTTQAASEQPGSPLATPLTQEAACLTANILAKRETRSRDPRTAAQCIGIRVALTRGNTPLRRSAGATGSPSQPALWVQGASSDLPVSPCTHNTRHACEAGEGLATRDARTTLPNSSGFHLSASSPPDPRPASRDAFTTSLP